MVVMKTTTRTAVAQPTPLEFAALRRTAKLLFYKPGWNHVSVPSRHHGSIGSRTVVTKQLSPAGDNIKAHLGAHDKARKNYRLNRHQRRVTT